jgi:hypothetical protein
MSLTDATNHLSGLAEVPTVSGEFDFLVGHWRVDNRRLVAPLAGGHEWLSSTAIATSRIQHGGAISIDEMWYPEQGFAGTSVRLRSPDGSWTIYWVNSSTGLLQAPVTGRWDESGARFVATGTDEFEGREILARFLWHSIGSAQATWEQAFSVDDGVTWETNWVMTWDRERRPS